MEHYNILGSSSSIIKNCEMLNKIFACINEVRVALNLRNSSSRAYWYSWWIALKQSKRGSAKYDRHYCVRFGHIFCGLISVYLFLESVTWMYHSQNYYILVLVWVPALWSLGSLRVGNWARYMVAHGKYYQYNQNVNQGFDAFGRTEGIHCWFRLCCQFASSAPTLKQWYWFDRCDGTVSARFRLSDSFNLLNLLAFSISLAVMFGCCFGILVVCDIIIALRLHYLLTLLKLFLYWSL